MGSLTSERTLMLPGGQPVVDPDLAPNGAIDGAFMGALLETFPNGAADAWFAQSRTAWDPMQRWYVQTDETLALVNPEATYNTTFFRTSLLFDDAGDPLPVAGRSIQDKDTRVPIVGIEWRRQPTSDYNRSRGQLEWLAMIGGVRDSLALYVQRVTFTVRTRGGRAHWDPVLRTVVYEQEGERLETNVICCYLEANGHAQMHIYH